MRRARMNSVQDGPEIRSEGQGPTLTPACTSCPPAHSCEFENVAALRSAECESLAAPPGLYHSPPRALLEELLSRPAGRGAPSSRRGWAHESVPNGPALATAGRVIVQLSTPTGSTGPQARRLRRRSAAPRPAPADPGHGGPRSPRRARTPCRPPGPRRRP